MIRPSWSRERSRLVHDQLKNQLLPCLMAQMRAEDAGVLEREKSPKKFTHEVESLWAELGSALRFLIQRFAVEMSPATYLRGFAQDRKHREAYQWMEVVVHEWWITKVNASRLTEDARQALDEVDLSIKALQATRKMEADAWHLAVRRLYDSCQLLGGAFARFPDCIVF